MVLLYIWRSLDAIISAPVETALEHQARRSLKQCAELGLEASNTSIRNTFKISDFVVNQAKEEEE